MPAVDDTTAESGTVEECPDSPVDLDPGAGDELVIATDAFEGWVGNGRPITSGGARFTRYSKMGSILDLPPMSCGPGVCHNWNLRTKGYAKTGKKGASSPSLYEFLGAELISSPDPLYSLQDETRFPPAPTFDTHGLPHTLLVVLQLPLCEKPAMFSQGTGGKTVNTVLLFRIKEDSAKEAAAAGDRHPAYDLLKKFSGKLGPEFVGHDHDPMLGRFKLLVRSATGVPTTFSKFNGKPVLVTGSGKFKRSACGGIMEVCVNTRYWKYPARLALYSNWNNLGEYRLQVGLCLEGRSDEELDERLLGCCSLSLPRMLDTAPGINGEASPK